MKKILIGASMAMVSIVFPLKASSQPPNSHPIVSSGLSKYAESLFNQLELVSGITPSTSSASFSDDGYFYRDYGTTRFGVKSDGSDPRYYRSKNLGPWEVIGSYKESDVPRIIIIGKINPGFAKTIANDAMLQDSDIAVNGPILLSKKLNRLSPGEKWRLLSSYNAGYPVAALDVSAIELQKIARFLGMPSMKVTNDKYNLAGVYRTNGDQSTLKLVKPSTKKSTRTSGELSEIQYAEQASIYFRWIRDSMRLQPAVTAKLAASAASFISMDDLLNSDVNEISYFSNGAHFNIQTYFSVVKDIKNNQFYVYGKQLGRMASGGMGLKLPPGTPIEVTSIFRHLVKRYSFTNILRNGSLIEQAPPTTEGKSTITSGINWSIGGEFSTSNPQIEAGVQVQSSKTYEIPDISVVNNSGSHGGSPTSKYDVDYEIAWPDGARIPAVAYATWTARNEFLFKVPNDGKQVVMDLYFGCYMYNWVWDSWSGWHLGPESNISIGKMYFCYNANSEQYYWHDTHVIKTP